MSRNGTLRPLPVLVAHLCGIKSMRLKIFSELDVFFLNSILIDLWQAPDEESRQEAERACNIERILPSASAVCSTAGVLNVREDVVANEPTARELVINYGKECL